MVTQQKHKGWYVDCTNADGSPKDCGFQLRVEDREQILDLAKEHCDRTHKAEGYTRDMIAGAIRQVQY